MNDLFNFYQEMILDHNKKPRNFREIKNAAKTLKGFNPLCGDQLTLYLSLSSNGEIEDIAFQGTGCAISIASASLMTTAVKKKKIEDALLLFEKVHTLLTRGPDEEQIPEGIGELAALSGVWEFPTRVKCAVLAWHTLRNSLESLEV